MTITTHDCRLANDYEYRKGYAYGIDHDFVYDVMSADELISFSKIYKSFETEYSDGLAFYLWETAVNKGAIIYDPDTTQTNSHVVSSGIR
jgi:hypothetical protein